MIYRCPDGATFRSYQAMCDHMIELSLRQKNYTMALYYKKEKEKMTNRQETEFPIFIIFIIIFFIAVLFGWLK